jgi:predicted dehydrogenase
VVGLGLIGQLTARLAAAAGLRVFGVDLRDWTVARLTARGLAAEVEKEDSTTESIIDWSRGRGVDAVLLTAATPSSSPVQLAPARLRDRGRIVVVGDVGLDLERTPLYEKEIDVRVARSYGPGRYDRTYEDWGVDYPIGHVRFTEGRNIESVLDLIADGRLDVADLVTHTYEFDHVLDAYATLAKPDEQYLGIQIAYPAARTTQPATPRVVTTGRSIAMIGAGNFARSVLAPAIATSGLGKVSSVSSATGTSAAHLASRIEATAVTVDDALGSDCDIVVVATSHDTHADLVIRALNAGKHVFSEKPLALAEDELDAVRDAWTASGRQLAVGFNRRHSPDVVRARELLGAQGGPLVMTYRVNAGALPASHWYHDRRMGGRLIGEVCHFIDTCNALARSAVVRVAAFGDHRREPLLANDLGVLLSYADGSVAAISYASGGHASTAKERLEILGRGHSIVIDDYRSITIDGRTEKHPQDKGHVAQLRAFDAALRSGDSGHTKDSLDSMRATLLAARHLLGGDVTSD